MAFDTTSACDVGLVPEPPEKPLCFLRLFPRILDNELWLYSRGDFTTQFSQSRHGRQQYVLLNQLHGVQHILNENHQNYAKSRLTKSILGPLFGQGLFTSEGEAWRCQRRTLAAAFDTTNIAASATIVTECAAAMLDRWQTVKTDSPSDIVGEMARLTIEIAGKALFSVDLAESAEDVRAAVTLYLRRHGRPRVAEVLGLPGLLPRRRSSRVTGPLAQIDRQAAYILRERAENPPVRADLITFIDKANNRAAPRAAVAQERRDQIVTFLLAGYETTSAVLSWVWFLLSQHPRVERQLHEELETALGGRMPTFDDLGRLTYTGMVFDEALRLFPPIHTFNRVALADDQIDGKRISAGAVVTISPYLMHRNPRLWAEPRRFDPDRFLPSERQDRLRRAYFPFGMGPRTCIGRAFARMESQLIIATIAQAYRLRLDPTRPVEARARVTLHPRHGIWMRAERRT